MVPRRRLLIALLVAIFVKSSSYGVMFTMLDDYRNQFGISEGSLGLVIAIGFFTSFFAQLFIAPFADRGASRRLIIVGLSLAIGGNFFMAFADSLPELLFGRFVSGLGIGSALPAMRRVIIVADPENLGRNLGRVLSSEVAGFAMGPVLATLLVAPFGIPAPYIVVGVLLLASAVVLLRYDIPETTKHDQPTERLAVDLLRDRAIVAAVLLGVALFYMIGTFDSLWVLMMDDIGAPSWMANVGISLFAIPLIVLGPRGGKFVQSVGPYRAGGVGLLVGGLCMATYGVFSSPVVLMGILLIHMTNDGMTVTGAGVAIGSVAPTERQAGAQGLLGGAQTLTGGVSSSLAGFTYELYGRTVSFVISGVVIVVLVTVSRTLAAGRWSIRGAQLTEHAN